MNHYINTAEVEPTRARTPSLIASTPQPFPVLFFGDIRSHSFFFHADGTIESFSGSASYTLRVTLGDAQAAPFGGTYTVTCGSTSAALPYNTTAEVLQAALNGLTTISSEGAVTVEGEFPTFMVYANAVGARTNITANAALLNPNGAITIEVLTTGTGSVRQEWRISLRRNVISSDDTWTVIASPHAGWQGNLTTNTEGALALLVNEGELVGGLLQAQTLVTVEVIDASANVVSYFQMPFILRAKPTDLAATASTPMASYQPLSAKLSAFANLANAVGVLQNDGAGTLSWTPSAGGAEWGDITGDIEDQADLVAYVLSNPGGLPAANDAFIVVLSTSDPAANGVALLAAYAAAKALTPNGAALSATNRAAVIIPPGKYTLVTPLTLDTQFVDLIGATNKPEETIVTSAITTASSGTIVQLTGIGDVIISGLTIRNTASTRVANNSTDAAAWHFFASLSATKVSNCIFDGSGTSWGMTQGAHCDGTYKDCEGDDRCFGSNGGNFLGFATDCVADSNSFGTELGGNAIVTRCTAGDLSFGSTNFYGRAIDCFAASQSFGKVGFFGFAERCKGTSQCFGGNSGTCSGVVVDCRATGGSFGGGGGTFSGYAKDCFAGDFCFGYGGTCSGIAHTCYAGENSFGHAGTFSGQLIDCVCGLYSGNDYSATFAKWSIAWAPTTFTGKVSNMTFDPTGSNVNAATVPNGATGEFNSCTFKKTGTGVPLGITAAGSATIKFSFCRFNTASGIEAGITNALGATLADAFCIGDTDL